jgi:lysylphosphatidylglycerol synthetase-like protein (DUF2156 family)
MLDVIRTVASPRNEGLLVDLVEQFGGPLSPVVFDSTCELFTVSDVVGAIPYRRSLRSHAVALGDPLCETRHLRRLLEEFCNSFHHTIFAAASHRLIALASQLGFASIEFGEELTIDPRRGPPRGRRAHGLRRKLNHASRLGVSVAEYTPARGVDRALEAALERTVEAWLAGRRGLQAYVAHVDLFQPRALRRWLYAVKQRDVIGLLTLVHVGARQGWLLEHLIAVPTAPAGTSELLVTSALEVLGAEGCESADFGTSTAHALGKIEGLPALSEWIGRRFFAWAQHAFHIDSVGDFRRKFGDVCAQPSYLLFRPPHVGVRELYALVRAFNVGSARRERRGRVAARSAIGSEALLHQLVYLWLGYGAHELAADLAVFE